MVVNITVTKLNGGIRVNVATLKNNEPTAQEYDSVQQAGAVLLDMGVPKEAVDFYLSQLFPTITVNEETRFSYNGNSRVRTPVAWLSFSKVRRAATRRRTMIGFTMLTLSSAEYILLLVMSAMFLVGVWLLVNEIREWKKKRAQNRTTFLAGRRKKAA